MCWIWDLSANEQETIELAYRDTGYEQNQLYSSSANTTNDRTCGNRCPWLKKYITSNAHSMNYNQCISNHNFFYIHGRSRRNTPRRQEAGISRVPIEHIVEPFSWTPPLLSSFPREILSQQWAFRTKSELLTFKPKRLLFPSLPWAILFQRWTFWENEHLLVFPRFLARWTFREALWFRT